MEPVLFMVTSAGLDALVDAQGGGTDPIQIASLGLTENAFVMAPTITSVPGELKRITAIAGQSVSETAIHMTAQDVSEDIYELRGMGLYLADGTLFAIYSQPTPLFRKVSISFFLMALDIGFSSGVAGDIVFGDTSFLLPPATETVQGIAELATTAETTAGTDNARIVTPLKLKQRLDALLAPITTAISDLLARTILGGGLVTGGGNLSASRTLTVTAASAAEVAAGAVANKAMTPASLSGLTDRTITGGGLVTGGGNLTASRTLTVAAASAADVTAGTATDKAVTPAALAGLARDLSQNGYAVLPGAGGLIVQWGRFTASPNGSTATVFPIAFPNACFSVAGGGTVVGGADSQDNPPLPIVSSISPTGFSVFSADDTSDGVSWIAVGN